MSCGRLISPPDFNSGLAISSLEPSSNAPSGKTLLLGLGNDLLSDDSVGLRIVDAARECLADCGNVVVLKTTEMGLALLDLIVGFDHLILVDAIVTGQAPPGFVHQAEVKDLKLLPANSPHFFGVGEVLALGRELAIAVPTDVKILAIEVQDPFTISPQMSPALEKILPRLIEQIVAETRKIASVGETNIPG